MKRITALILTALTVVFCAALTGCDSCAPNQSATPDSATADEANELINTKNLADDSYINFSAEYSAKDKAVTFTVKNLKSDSYLHYDYSDPQVYIKDGGSWKNVTFELPLYAKTDTGEFFLSPGSSSDEYTLAAYKRPATADSPENELKQATEFYEAGEYKLVLSARLRKATMMTNEDGVMVVSLGDDDTDDVTGHLEADFTIK